jgi:hypothetical protein
MYYLPVIPHYEKINRIAPFLDHDSLCPTIAKEWMNQAGLRHQYLRM